MFLFTAVMLLLLSDAQPYDENTRLKHVLCHDVMYRIADALPTQALHEWSQCNGDLYNLTTNVRTERRADLMRIKLRAKQLILDLSANHTTSGFGIPMPDPDLLIRQYVYGFHSYITTLTTCHQGLAVDILIPLHVCFNRDLMAQFRNTIKLMHRALFDYSTAIDGFEGTTGIDHARIIGVVQGAAQRKRFRDFLKLNVVARILFRMAGYQQFQSGARPMQNKYLRVSWMMEQIGFEIGYPIIIDPQSYLPKGSSFRGCARQLALACEKEVEEYILPHDISENQRFLLQKTRAFLRQIHLFLDDVSANNFTKV